MTRRRLPLLASVLAAAALAADPVPLPLGNGHVLVPTATITDDQGHTHVRLQDTYQGLRVWGSETVLHPDDPADPAPASGLSLLALGAPVLGLDLVPGVPLDDAFQAVRADLGAPGLSAQLTPLETVVYPFLAAYPVPTPGQPLNAAQVLRYPAGYTLAYRIQALPLEGRSEGQAWECLVDAHTGRVLERSPLDPELTAAKGQARTFYSGDRTIDVAVEGSQYQLIDLTRGTVKGTARFSEPYNSVEDASFLFLPLPRARPTWGDGQVQTQATAQSSATYDTMAADAMYGLQNAWDYYQRIHRRNGWDDRGTSVRLVVHSKSLMDNAYWSLGEAKLGIGEVQSFYPRSSPKTVAHEFTHGVTESTANLQYRGEAGGLNEATSDIFSIMIDTWRKNGAGPAIGANQPGDWRVILQRPGLLGGTEDILARSLIKPSLNHFSADVWSLNVGSMDPHDASGPINRAFYFLSQGATRGAGLDTSTDAIPAGFPGIGNDDAARIWYQTLTTTLTQTSTFLAARTGALRAAGQLFGAGSAQQRAVANAFAAVRVGDPAAPPGDRTPPLVTLGWAQAGPRLTLTADARDNDRVASVTYLVDNVPVGSATVPPYTLALDSARLLANGDHSLTAMALDRSGNQAASTLAGFTLANPYQQILKDPGLEQQADVSPWTGRRDTGSRSDPPALLPHGGADYALFQHPFRGIVQRVTIPAGVAQATLSFWIHITGNPQAPAGATLTARVAATDPASLIPAATREFSNRDAREDWVRCSLPVTALRGQEVWVSFIRNGVTDPDTRFRVDDIALVCGDAPVAVTVNPATVDLEPGAVTDPFTAQVDGASDPNVTWTVREAGGGTLDAARRYTAPSRPGFYHLVAAAQADPLATGEVSIRVRPVLGMAPLEATVPVNGTCTFTLALPPGLPDPTLAFREGAAAGTIARTPGSATVVVTASGTPGTYHLVASGPAGSGLQAVATVTVVSVPTIQFTPPALTLAAGSRFLLVVAASDNSPLNLAVSDGGGTLDAGYLGPDDYVLGYTAPAAPGTYQVVATDALNPACRATLTVTVRPGLVLNPPQATVLPGDPMVLTATLAGQTSPIPGLAWTVTPGGTLAADGDQATFTATAPGTYQVQVATGSAPQPAVATIEVKVPDPDGDRSPATSFQDLAAVVHAHGSAAPDQDWNGDGIVDDQDLAAVLEALEAALSQP